MHIHSVLESREESHKVTRKGFRRDTQTETLSCGAPYLRQRPPAPADENPDRSPRPHWETEQSQRSLRRPPLEAPRALPWDRKPQQRLGCLFDFKT